MAATMTTGIAVKDLLIEEIRALKQTKNDVFEYFMKNNVSKTTIEYITKLWDYKKDIAGSMVSIGKIIVMKIIDFIKANPNIAFGTAMGAIAGVMIGSFVGFLPFIGQILTTLSISGAILIGAMAGDRIDRANQGEYIDESMLAIFGDTILIAKKFIMLFLDIILTIKNS